MQTQSVLKDTFGAVVCMPEGCLIGRVDSSNSVPHPDPVTISEIESKGILRARSQFRVLNDENGCMAKLKTMKSRF